MIKNVEPLEHQRDIELSLVMSWSEANSVADDLIHHRFDYGMGLLIKIGIYTPLLISDILRLKWIDLLNKNKTTLGGIENKKGQYIPFNKHLQKNIENVYELYCKFHGRDIDLSEYVITRNGEHMNSMKVGRFFAKLHKMYPLLQRPIKVTTLRATFGRRIISQYGETPEVMSLLKNLFGQASSNGVRKALLLDMPEDDLSLDSIFSKLNKNRAYYHEIDGTVHRKPF